MKIIINKARLSFPGLFVAKPYQPGDEPKFKATFLIEKGSQLDKTVWAAVYAAAEAKWPGKGKKIVESIKANPNRCGYQDGDSKDYDGYAGMMALTAKSTIRPTVLDRDKSPLVEADGKPYAGCYVAGSVEVFCYDKPGQGVSFGLKGVQYHSKGDAFGGGAPANPDDFEDLGVEEESTEDLAG